MRPTKVSSQVLSESVDAQLSHWRRLSPLSIFFFVSKTIATILKESLASLAPLGVVILSSDNKLLIISLVFTGVVLLTLVNGFLQFWFFKFKLDGQKLLINDGVFKKNHRVIQFDRIQNINVLQPLYFKLWDLVTLQIETAGAKGNEADLAGISAMLAESLRQQVLAYKQHASPSDALAEAEQQVNDRQKLLANASFKDLLKYGVSSNGIFWFFVFIAPLFSMLDDVLEQWITKEDFTWLVNFFGGGIQANILIAVISFVVLILLMFFFSILGAVFRYFNYALTLNFGTAEPTIKRVSGLLTRYEESLKLSKIQSYIVSTNFIGRWLKVYNITLGQVSTSQAPGKQKKSLFIVPARTSDEAKVIEKSVFANAPKEIPTQGINKRYINKTLWLKIFMPSLAVFGFLAITGEIYWLLAAPFLLVIIFLPLVILRWRAYQYGMSSGYGRFERGLFGFRHVTFPLYKVQRAEVRQSPIQRRKNLATLKIYLASNKLQMQYIPIEVANHWVDQIAKEIKNAKVMWF